MRSTFFEQNFRGRMVLIAAQRHIAQQYISYPEDGMGRCEFQTEAGREAFLIVAGCLHTLEMEFRVKKKLRRRAA